MILLHCILSLLYNIRVNLQTLYTCMTLPIIIKFFYALPNDNICIYRPVGAVLF